MNFFSTGARALFTPWNDPESSVRSFVLSERVAPVQQTFYFTNEGASADGRFFWFYCAFPPGGDAYYGRQLGRLDFAEQSLRYFPETQFMDASPFVEPDTGEVYWTTGLEVWKRGPRVEDKAVRVGSFPAELANGRRPLRLATHLSRSADGKAFAVDAQLGAEWFVGELPLDGSTFRLWQKFDRCHNHTQFSPTDPDLLLTAQDEWSDPATGRKGTIQDRLWLLRRGGQARPVFPEDPSALRGHEWWDADGLHVWYVRYHRGTERVNILTGQCTLVWPGELIHAHADKSGQYLVADRVVAPETWSVAFFNVRTGRAIDIASRLAPLDEPRARYHVHPHPRFCMNDRYVCYTTNVLGRVDVAFVPVEELIGKTS